MHLLFVSYLDVQYVSIYNTLHLKKHADKNAVSPCVFQY